MRKDTMMSALPNVSRWYQRTCRTVQASLPCFVLLLVLYACTTSADANASASTLAPPMSISPTIQPHGALAATPTPKPILRPQATRSAKPMVAKPTPKAAKPPPTPCPGVNCNPWGYNFVPGKLITSPPATFCNYFACIPNFVNGKGYVVECHDTMYSQSGGIQGACSFHAGVLRPLYSH